MEEVWTEALEFSSWAHECMLITVDIKINIKHANENLDFFP